MPPASSSARSESQNRQKRVLPSRLRRGGPGIGSCDADNMILETHKRQSENEPLIPATTGILLTTNSALVPQPSESDPTLEVNTHAHLRYFDRPEVLEAYRKQLHIQTPDFVLLSESAGVGGRFRPRGLEDQEVTDTSDAVYEKRHRKFEIFEKRQRLREKEKLKHEHYKLKERIEQLRAMDNAAFLTLSPSYFTPVPAAAHSDDEESPPNSHGGAQHEGERRRQEMLNAALGLEERYRTLLPTERKPGNERERASVSARESSEPDEGELEQDEDDEDQEPAAQQAHEKLKLKIRFPPRNAYTKQHKYGKGVANGRTTRKSRLTATSSPSASQASLRPKSRVSPLRVHSPDAHTTDGESFVEDTDSDSDTRPHKRGKRTHLRFDRDSRSPSPAKSTASRGRKTTCTLLMSALRHSSIPQARKTQRNVTAFGTKVPAELEEIRDFELPWWIMEHREDLDNDGEEAA